MGLFSKDIKTLDDLFGHGLQDIYYAENQIVKSLPGLIEKASDPQLKRGLQTHLEETEKQVERLEQVFRLREEKPKGTKCHGILGLLKEGDEAVGNIADKSVLDAALIAAAQSVEHYEITRYGALIAWAKEMGRDDFATILAVNLDEEEATDRKLTKLAEGGVNRKAGPRKKARRVDRDRRASTSKRGARRAA